MNFTIRLWHKFLHTKLGTFFLIFLLFFGLLSAFLIGVQVWRIGTFEGWLTLLTCVTGVGYAFYHLKVRRAKMRSEGVSVAQHGQLGFLQKTVYWFSDLMAGVFPILLLVLLLRSFFFEPFRIPSGSMLPTLHLGDFILVNKYAYGLKLPVYSSTILPLGQPQRGDIVVFRFPDDESLDYIKRVVGVPNDVIKIVGNQVTVNDQLISAIDKGTYQGKQWQYVGGVVKEYKEKNLNMSEHQRYAILWDMNRLSAHEQTYRVPAGHYFVMGDNRSNSNDSRYWGWVPAENIKGKASYVWFNWFDEIDWSRIGIRL